MTTAVRWQNRQNPQGDSNWFSVDFGKGRALKTAFNHFLNAYPACKGLVTVDADGQHKVPDIRACCDAMLAQGVAY